MNRLNESMTFPIEDYINEVLKEDEAPREDETAMEETPRISSANFLACSLYVECKKSATRLDSAKADIQDMKSRVSRRSATVAKEIREYFDKCKEELAKREHQLLREVAFRSMVTQEDLRATLRAVEDLKDKVGSRASELRTDERLSLRERMQKYVRLSKELNSVGSLKIDAGEIEVSFVPQYKLLDDIRTTGRLLTAPTLDYFVVPSLECNPPADDADSWSGSGDSGIRSVSRMDIWSGSVIPDADTML